MAMILAAATSDEMGRGFEVAYGLGLGVLLVMNLITFFRPKPALHKQFADRTDMKEALEKLEGKIDGLVSKIEESGSSQYNARRRMHAQLNAHSNALHFIAGRLTGKGDADGQHLRQILRRAEDAEHE